MRFILFGSRLRGEASKHSDIDVTVVSLRFDCLKRTPMVLGKVPFPKHTDYMCYIPEDFDRIRQESAIITDALRDYVAMTV